VLTLGITSANECRVGGLFYTEESLRKTHLIFDHNTLMLENLCLHKLYYVSVAKHPLFVYLLKPASCKKNTKIPINVLKGPSSFH